MPVDNTTYTTLDPIGLPTSSWRDARRMKGQEGGGGGGGGGAVV